MSRSMSRGWLRLGCCEMTIFAPRSLRSAMIELESKALSAILWAKICLQNHPAAKRDRAQVAEQCTRLILHSKQVATAV